MAPVFLLVPPPTSSENNNGNNRTPRRTWSEVSSFPSRFVGWVPTASGEDRCGDECLQTQKVTLLMTILILIIIALHFFIGLFTFQDSSLDSLIFKNQILLSLITTFIKRKTNVCKIKKNMPLRHMHP